MEIINENIEENVNLNKKEIIVQNQVPTSKVKVYENSNIYVEY